MEQALFPKPILALTFLTPAFNRKREEAYIIVEGWVSNGFDPASTQRLVLCGQMTHADRSPHVAGHYDSIQSGNGGVREGGRRGDAGRRDAGKREGVKWEGAKG